MGEQAIWEGCSSRIFHNSVFCNTMLYSVFLLQLEFVGTHLRSNILLQYPIKNLLMLVVR